MGEIHTYMDHYNKKNHCIKWEIALQRQSMKLNRENSVFRNNKTQAETVIMHSFQKINEFENTPGRKVKISKRIKTQQDKA